MWCDDGPRPLWICPTSICDGLWRRKVTHCVFSVLAGTVIVGKVTVYEPAGVPPSPLDVPPLVPPDGPPDVPPHVPPAGPPAAPPDVPPDVPPDALPLLLLLVVELLD